MGENKDFETALSELESVVAEMEKPGTPLDDMLKSFEHARKLVAFCDEELNRIKKRVEAVINKDAPLAATADSLPVEEIPFE